MVLNIPLASEHQLVENFQAIVQSEYFAPYGVLSANIIQTLPQSYLLRDTGSLGSVSLTLDERLSGAAGLSFVQLTLSAPRQAVDQHIPVPYAEEVKLILYVQGRPQKEHFLMSLLGGWRRSNIEYDSEGQRASIRKMCNGACAHWCADQLPIIIDLLPHT